LKQGADVWNEWRKDNEFVEIDLSEVDLRNANLRGVKLYRANLVRANLSGAKLIEARLHETDLTGAELMEADLQKAILEDAIFNFAFLDDANLRQANLVAATFLEAYLTGTDLRGTDLRLCNLSGANLREANLNGATVGTTIFARLDLSETGGLEEVNHDSPAQISTDTLKLSEGKIPEVFLRGCGLSDWEIESAKLYNPDLTNDEIAKIQYRIYELRATQALQISPLVISYSHQDKSFVDKIDTALTKKGVRFWRDIHDATAGRLETQIDRAMRLNPTVCVIGSFQ
jgi:Pentapeptide repeats (8 copies)/TIR domain